MKKQIFVSVIFALVVLFNTYAGDKKIKLGKNQIAVIAKVSVNTQTNLKFFEQVFDLTEEDKARPSNYFMPMQFPKKGVYPAADVEDFEQTAEAEDGQYCIAIYTLPSNGVLYLTGGIRYLYHKMYALDILLPTGFKVQVPEDAKVIYLGDFNYTVSGDDFTVTAAKLTESYDAAADFVKSIPGLEAEKLCRVELNNITEEEFNEYGFKCSIDMSKGNKRFVMMNGVYSYKE